MFITVLLRSSEFKRWLADQGATFKPGKGSHLKVTPNGNEFCSADARQGTRYRVGGGYQKQLGLK